MQPQEEASPDFSYQFANSNLPSYDDIVPFALTPADSRYYENNMKEGVKLSPNYEVDYQGSLAKEEDKSAFSNNDDIPSSKLKAPMEVKPKYNVLKSREDLKSLIEKLQISGQDSAIINNGQFIHQNDVTKKHLEMDAAVGMYVVALIAGVSAAVTVGLIALGIGWYT